MYEMMPLDHIGITDDFGHRKDPITGVDTYHYAIDLGWKKYQGEPVYAIYDSEVVYEGYDSTLGNYIVLTYKKNNKTIVYRFFHLKNRAIPKKGAKVKRKEIIGYMGTTGYSTGVHLHFEYWICPENYIYSSNDRGKYAVDPLKYVYLFENQTMSVSDYPILKVVGTKSQQLKNEKINQLEVIGEKLNCRNEPSLKGTILGYIDYGIYNILETKESDNYTWHKIDENKWIANVKDNVKIYLVEEQEGQEWFDNFTMFKAPKDNYYYIYLKKEETIFFPK